MAKQPFNVANPLYLITDKNIAGSSYVSIVRQALSAGISVFQLRDKDLTKKELYREALTIRELTLKHKAAFIINDHIDIALAVDADGVHLGQDDMPLEEARRIMGKKKVIGISTHSLKQALEAERGGADYIGFGPMFSTSTKDAGCPKGIRKLSEIRRHVSIPIAAIGGIMPANIHEVMRAGASAVAVISGILKGDIKTNTARYLDGLGTQ